MLLIYAKKRLNMRLDSFQYCLIFLKRLSLFYTNLFKFDLETSYSAYVNRA